MKVNPDDFTECAWLGIVDAKNIATSERHQTLETEHLLCSLLKKNQTAIKILERSGGSIKGLINEVEEFIIDESSLLTKMSNSRMIELMKKYKLPESHIQKVVMDLPIEQ